MSTIYDIARVCGLSAATVSYVLNGKDSRISQATRERVLSAAENLNYRLNTSAKRLSDRTENGISIALFWPNYSFEQHMISAMRGLKNIVRTSVEPPEINLRFYEPGSISADMSILTGQPCNGILLAGADGDDLAAIRANMPSVPLVLVNRAFGDIPSVTIDQCAAGREACDIIHSRSGGSFLTVWEDRRAPSPGSRKTAFEKRAVELGLDLTGRLALCDESREGGYELAAGLLRRGAEHDVIYSNNEEIARGMMCAFTEGGLRVGSDVQIFTTTVAPSSHTRYCVPSMTVIDLRMREVFERAFSLCISLIMRRKAPAENIVLPPVTIYRDSLSAELCSAN